MSVHTCCVCGGTGKLWAEALNDACPLCDGLGRLVDVHSEMSTRIEAPSAKPIEHTFNEGYSTLSPKVQAYFEQGQKPPEIARSHLDEMRRLLRSSIDDDALFRELTARVGQDFSAFQQLVAAQNRAARKAVSHGFEHQFKTDPDIPHKKKGYLQRVFQVPARPEDVTTLHGLIAWLAGRIAPWPVLGIASGNHNVALSALQAAAAACGGDAAHLYDLVERAEHLVQNTIVQSKLWDSLMREDGLFSLDALTAVFATQSPCFPDPVCPTSEYCKCLWVRDYSGRAFISVDIRKANFSVLQIMSSLVDIDLNKKLRSSWEDMLGDILEAPARDAVMSCKQFRQTILGGLHLEWIARQRPRLSAQEFQQLQSKREYFAKSEGGFNKASKDAQQTIMRHVAAAVSTACELPVFAFLGDEVKFLLPAKCSVFEADEMALKVHGALLHVFKQEYHDFQRIFVVDSNLILDLGPYYQDTDHGSYVVLCRRATASGVPEPSLQLKGIRGSNRLLEDSKLKRLGNGVCSLQRQCASEWNAWCGEIAPAPEK